MIYNIYVRLSQFQTSTPQQHLLKRILIIITIDTVPLTQSCAQIRILHVVDDGGRRVSELGSTVIDFHLSDIAIISPAVNHIVSTRIALILIDIHLIVIAITSIAVRLDIVSTRIPLRFLLGRTIGLILPLLAIVLAIVLIVVRIVRGAGPGAIYSLYVVF